MIEMGMLNPNVSKNEAIYQLMDYLESDERREIHSHPVNKDTFPLTAGGYVVTRIFTDNPGMTSLDHVFMPQVFVMVHEFILTDKILNKFVKYQ